MCLCFRTCVVTNKPSVHFLIWLILFKQKNIRAVFPNICKNTPLGLSLSLSLSLSHTHTHTHTCTHTRPPCRPASEYMAPTPSLRPSHLRSNAVPQFAEDSVCSCGQEMPPFSFPLSLPHPLLEPAPLWRPRNTER